MIHWGLPNCPLVNLLVSLLVSQFVVDLLLVRYRGALVRRVQETRGQCRAVDVQSFPVLIEHDLETKERG